MGQVKVYLYSLIHMFRHDPKPTSNVRVDNFLHDPQTRHEFRGLWLKGLTCLIKRSVSRLTNIILYPRHITDQHANTKCYPMIHPKNVTRSK